MRLHTALLLGLLAAAGCNTSSGDADVAAAPTAPPRTASGPTASASAAAPVNVAVPATAMPADEHGGAAMPAQRAVTDRFREYVAPKREPRDLTLVSVPVAGAPVIDGRASEELWMAAPAVTTLDFSSQRPITLRAAHTSKEVFFLVTFREEIPHETHKTWTWDAKEEVYREGHDREDVFVFKWSMSGNTVDLRLREPMPHKSDIWFWKAHRTNPSGYADDKGQGISTKPSPMARKIRSKRNGTLYFDRWADAGTPPWNYRVFFEYKGDRLDQFEPREPAGSRGDVRAKGVWAKGQWTIEFARKLDTGHQDDVMLVPGREHLFAVACYAMALDTPHQEWSRPLYRTGDAFDRLFLTFAPGSHR